MASESTVPVVTSLLSRFSPFNGCRMLITFAINSHVKVASMLSLGHISSFSCSGCSCVGSNQIQQDSQLLRSTTEHPKDKPL
jgi:hypothetical protein